MPGVPWLPGTDGHPGVVPPALPGTGGASGGNGDVCALGRQLGGWRPGSPEAAICEQAYGH
ncbi:MULTISPECIES: hypothetical protein [unclassified Streptomyces]|uniref:hypothetical protein n=1 Tax=unclassified Streptomyces TaxID=2593676 RepID=UPI001928850E|nr:MULTISPECIES: hypothetical protein [unclassified Streptomyces]